MRISTPPAVSLVLILVMACQSDGATPAGVPEVPSIDSTRFEQLARAVATNDLTAAKVIARTIPAEERALSDSQIGALAESSDDWGPATIFRWQVAAKIGHPSRPEENWAYGWMEHNGHVGEIVLNVDLKGPNGEVLQHCCSTPKRELNRLAPFLSSTLMYSVNPRPPSACGNSINAGGAMSAWFLSWIPLRWDPYGPMGETRGLTTKTGSAADTQPPCAIGDPNGPGGGDGGGGDGGAGGAVPSGSTYEISACVYLDWFHGDGTYWYTEFLGCTTVSAET